MWAAEQPTVTAAQTAQACAMNMQSPTREAVLQALALFDVNSRTYQEAAEADQLHLLTHEHVRLPDDLPHQVMIKLYEQRLARPRTLAYPIYEQLRKSGPGRRCAYCRSQTARTLDHFIPKHHIGALAIEPWNLVPCCDSCNNYRGSRWDRTPHGRAIHPYFLPELGRWLRASVDVSTDPIEPVIVIYRAEPDPDLGQELCARVRAQFEALRLRQTIGTFAVDELQTVQRRLRTRFRAEHLAREYLAEEADILLQHDANSIRGVLYEALSASSAFICAHLGPA